MRLAGQIHLVKRSTWKLGFPPELKHFTFWGLRLAIYSPARWVLVLSMWIVPFTTAAQESKSCDSTFHCLFPPSASASAEAAEQMSDNPQPQLNPSLRGQIMVKSTALAAVTAGVKQLWTKWHQDHIICLQPYIFPKHSLMGLKFSMIDLWPKATLLLLFFFF